MWNNFRTLKDSTQYCIKDNDEVAKMCDINSKWYMKPEQESLLLTVVIKEVLVGPHRIGWIGETSG